MRPNAPSFKCIASCVNDLLLFTSYIYLLNLYTVLLVHTLRSLPCVKTSLNYFSEVLIPCRPVVVGGRQEQGEHTCCLYTLCLFECER